MLEVLKEKMHMTVYKAVIVQSVGNSTFKKQKPTVTEEYKQGKKVQTVTFEEVEIIVPRYRILKIKFVNPAKELCKVKIGKIKKLLPIDFQYEAYSHKEKHVVFVDWQTGQAVKLGGGLVDYAHPPREEELKSSLMRSVADLMTGQKEVMMLLLAVGMGVFAGYFIRDILPLLMEGF